MISREDNNVFKAVPTSHHGEAGSRDKASETTGTTISAYGNSRRIAAWKGNQNIKRNELCQNFKTNSQKLQQKVSTKVNCNDVCTKVSSGNRQNDFTEPMLLTSTKIIDTLHNLEAKISQSKSQAELTTQTKIGKQVNFPLEEKVFKGFINLRISDENLGINRPFKSKEIPKIKEPEPLLSDYYTPNFNKEYVMKSWVPTFELPKSTLPNVSSVYQATRHWEPEEFY